MKHHFPCQSDGNERNSGELKCNRTQHHLQSCHAVPSQWWPTLLVIQTLSSTFSLWIRGLLMWSLQVTYVTIWPGRVTRYAAFDYIWSPETLCSVSVLLHFVFRLSCFWKHEEAIVLLWTKRVVWAITWWNQKDKMSQADLNATTEHVWYLPLRQYDCTIMFVENYCSSTTEPLGVQHLILCVQINAEYTQVVCLVSPKLDNNTL